MSDVLLARAETHGLLLVLWCDAGRRWYVECEDLATNDTYRHVEVRGTKAAGMALYGMMLERMRDTSQHPASPTGEWWLIDDKEQT